MSSVALGGPPGLGIKEHQTRFAVLMSDSESDGDGAPKKKRQPLVGGGKTEQKRSKGDAASTALKNAKKRARRKKNQQPKDADGQTSSVQEPAEDIDAKKKEEQLTNDVFEKDLREALMMSKLEIEEKSTKPIAEDVSKEMKKGGKKGVTMSLHELHSTEFDVPKSTPAPPVVPSPRGLVDDHFFEELSSAVHKEMVKEKLRQHVPQSIVSEADMPRIAQLQYDLELRDHRIVELGVTVAQLKSEVEEVKKRNQALCMILGKGEFRTKASLLHQLDQLNGIKDELTAEIKELHEALEQEKSKNKHLKVDLAKFQQGSRNKSTSTSST